MPNGEFLLVLRNAALLKGMKVNVRAMAEGTVFRPLQPVMEIEGMYTDFGIYETALTWPYLPGIRRGNKGCPM